eukprot:2381559-Alexandrium_andersonii.AAC.2
MPPRARRRAQGESPEPCTAPRQRAGTLRLVGPSGRSRKRPRPELGHPAAGASPLLRPQRPTATRLAGAAPDFELRATTKTSPHFGSQS